MGIRHLSKRDSILLLELINESLACVSEEQVRSLMGSKPAEKRVAAHPKRGRSPQMAQRRQKQLGHINYPGDQRADREVSRG